MIATSREKDIDYWGKETYAMFGLSIQNKNGTINVQLDFLFDYV